MTVDVYYKPGCKPCFELRKLLIRNKISFNAIDVDTIDVYDMTISSVPMMIIKQDGKEVFRHYGTMSNEYLNEIISKYE